MDIRRKKQLIEEYKNRKPEMGILCFKFKAGEEIFLTASKDIRADINSNRFKMQLGNHPNKDMQKLWQAGGGLEGVEIFVMKEYAYKNSDDDHTDKLEALLTEYLAAHEGARRVWR